MQIYTENRADKNRLYGQNVMVFLLLFIGLAQIFDYLFPISIMDLSFFITIVPYFTVFFIFLLNINGIKTSKKAFYFLIVILSLFVLYGRSELYGEQFVNLIGGNRYVFFVPVVLILCNEINFKKISDKNIRYFLLLVLLIHTVNSFFFLIGFPCIDLVDISSEYYVEGSRFQGIMGGANVQAIFTSTIYMILVFSNANISIVKLLMLTAAALIAWTPTLSRGGFIIIFATLVYYLFLKKTINRMKVLFVFFLMTSIFISIIGISNILKFFSSFIDRFGDEDKSGGRFDRLSYFFETINSNTLYYFFGIPGSLQTVGEKTISDNVFTLLPSGFGIVYSVIFIYFLCVLFNKNNTNKKAMRQINIVLFLFILFVICFINNSILWTAWTFYAIFGFFYISYKTETQ